MEKVLKTVKSRWSVCPNIFRKSSQIILEFSAAFTTQVVFHLAIYKIVGELRQILVMFTKKLPMCLISLIALLLQWLISSRLALVVIAANVLPKLDIISFPDYFAC